MAKGVRLEVAGGERCGASGGWWRWEHGYPEKHRLEARRRDRCCKQADIQTGQSSAEARGKLWPTTSGKMQRASPAQAEAPSH